METRDTHTKRQATQHGCLPSLLGDGDKCIEIVYGEEKIFYTGPTRADKTEQKFSSTGTTGPTNKPKKDPFHLYCLSPFTSVSTVSKGQPSLVFLVETKEREIRKKDDKVYMYNTILKGPSGQIRSR